MLHRPLGRLQWDPVGTRCRGRNIPKYWRAHGIMVLFDLTDRASLTYARQWIQEIEGNTVKNVHVVLVGTKCDLKTERVVSEEDVKEFLMHIAEQLKSVNNRIAYVETSAKDNINVDLAFDVMAFEIVRRLRESTKECDPAFVVERDRPWQRATHCQCTPDAQARVKAVMCVWRLAGEGSGLGMLPVEVVDLILVMTHAKDHLDWEWEDTLLA
eukprot:TRINITY_DN2014_c0_g6_i1.p1 TRINITY_DN2014_c0_g6~~TRINITY_DN2014_c0_g6_i1.p1  ORF type:complete len:213 (-),score=35.08 TRINITY_DN2014_c0_g6_i1:134-772(-)